MTLAVEVVQFWPRFFFAALRGLGPTPSPPGAQRRAKKKRGQNWTTVEVVMYSHLPVFEEFNYCTCSKMYFDVGIPVYIHY